MNCEDISELSPLYLSRELDALRREEFHEHLASCPACLAEMEQLAEIDARVRDAILCEDVDTASLDRRVRQSIVRPVRRWLIATSVAAAIVIALIGYRVWSAPDRTCIAAADDHQREVVAGERRVWKLDLPAIGELAGRQGISSAVLVRLAPEGFRLERGKLCHLNGRAFLHLVYSGSDGSISVFLRQREMGNPGGIRTVDAGFERVAYFDTAGVSAIIVADRNSESALRLARVAAQIL